MKHPKKKQILRLLEDTPIVSAVCSQLGISRQTFYRWKQEDKEFDKLCEERLNIGTEAVNDLAESVLINQIKGGNIHAVKFWLSNKNKDYIRPRPENLPIYLINKKKNKIHKNNIQFVDFSEDA